jgi:hypothetical protein
VQSVVAFYSGHGDLASGVCVRNVPCSSTAGTVHATVLTGFLVRGFLVRGFPRQNNQEICLPVYVYV